MGTLLALLSGCAVTRMHADGSRQVFGLVSMTIPPATTPNGSAGETIDVSTVGLLLFSNPVGTGLALGYARERVTGLKNNTLVIGAPDGFPGMMPRRRGGQPATPNVEQTGEGSK